MRHLAIFLALIVGPVCAAAVEVEDRAQFGTGRADAQLRIISTADIRFFEPMITSFLADNPDSSIDYLVASSAELMRAIYEDGEAFDIAISSAMDLQTKLANDGFARRHTVSTRHALPEWAIWNDMLFAFTQEPATIVVSKEAFEDMPIPDDRIALINLLRQHPDRFLGKVGTYDIRQSGLGYLLATQDTRASETYWRLTEVMGALDAKLYCCSSDMIEAVKSGELLLAYNVLGSYAVARDDRDAFILITPSDFTTVMLRTAMIPHNAQSPALSGAFIDHLMRQSHGPNAAPLTQPKRDFGWVESSLNRIRIGPGLLVYLDQLKKAAFLNEWESAILQN